MRESPTFSASGVGRESIETQGGWAKVTKEAANSADRVGFTQFLMDGHVVYDDVIKFYYDQANEMFGTYIEPPE